MAAALVSIALCTYNGAKYLREQLDTLVGQTYPNWEIIAVDDCSTDDTVEVLEQYASIYPQIKLHINTENLGYTRNFEKAIRLCSGDYIALCDQDDIWKLNKISTMIEQIGDYTLVYHDSAFVDEKGELLNKKLSDIRTCYSGDDSRVFLFENCISGHAMLFKKELLQYFDGFHSGMMHDWWLAYIALNNGSVLYVDKVLVQYRQHSNASTNILRQKRSETIKVSLFDKMNKQLKISSLFASYKFNKDNAFKNKLLLLMEQRMTSYTSFSLAYFVFKNRHVLLWIQKKSNFSKLNFIIKLAWGYKLKKLTSSTDI